MNDVTRPALSKVPAVTLGFWVIKILATTLGETGGDTVTMTLEWGYLAGVVLFGVLLAALVVAQIFAKRFYRILYWATIVASTTFGTTLADFADRSLGIGYTGGSLLLLFCLLATLGLWHRSAGTVAVNTVSTPKVEAFYWATITFSQTLGTALGDWLADTHGVWLRARRAGIHGDPHGGRCLLLLDRGIACHLVLGRIHPDAASGRNGGRLHR